MKDIQWVELQISGMTCDGCARHVENALITTPGVTRADVPAWQSQRAIIQATEGTSIEALIEAVERSGYGAKPAVVQHTKATDTHTSGSTDGYSLIIVGGGSAAFAAAIKTSEEGGTALIVNEGLPTGGTCVNVGCVPSKTLIRAAEAHHRAAHPRFEGIESRSRIVDFQKIMDRKRELVSELRQKKYVDVIADDPNISLLNGRAMLVDDHTIQVGNKTYRGDNILIATGASPYIPDVPGLSQSNYLTNESAYELEEVPERLVVIGSGYIALENAQLFARFGAEVTVVQRSAHVLSDQPAEIAEALTGYLEEEGIRILTNTRLQEVIPGTTEISLKLLVDGKATTLRATHILVATGRRGNTSDLGLHNIGIIPDERGYLSVDDTLRTSVPTIFAAGDVVGTHQYVYTAAKEGNLAAGNALNRAHDRIDYSIVPWVVFTDPQVAGIGLDLKQAREAGIDAEVSTLALEHVPRSIAARDTRGFIQLIRNRETDLLVGARILAPEGSELLMELALAMRYRVPISAIASEMHPYLTLSEGIKLAALTFTKEVRKLSCCAV